MPEYEIVTCGRCKGSARVSNGLGSEIVCTLCEGYGRVYRTNFNYSLTFPLTIPNSVFVEATDNCDTIVSEIISNISLSVHHKLKQIESTKKSKDV